MYRNHNIPDQYSNNIFQKHLLRLFWIFYTSKLIHLDLTSSEGSTKTQLYPICCASSLLEHWNSITFSKNNIFHPYPKSYWKFSTSEPKLWSTVIKMYLIFMRQNLSKNYYFVPILLWAIYRSQRMKTSTLLNDVPN